jgi:hypothetical protein
MPLKSVWKKAGGVGPRKVLGFMGDANLLTHPPNLKYEERFLKAYREAHENGRGFWKSK